MKTQGIKGKLNKIKGQVQDAWKEVTVKDEEGTGKEKLNQIKPDITKIKNKFKKAA